MKQRGIWIAICLILVIGSSFTSYVRKYTGGEGEASFTELEISNRKDNFATSREPAVIQQEAEETLSEASVAREQISPFSLIAPKEPGVAAAMEPEPHAGELAPLTAEIPIATSSDIEEKKQADSQAKTSRIVSPAAKDNGEIWEGLEGQKMETGVVSEESESNSALIRLRELDNQIARNRAKETERTASASKNSAESEWKLWETEIQRMLGTLKECLDEQQQDTLMQQQRDWMRNREGQAVDASKKQRGTSMEEVSYNRSLAELTRARAYELAEIYGEYFKESKKP